MRYFDAHSHIQFPPFDEDRKVLLSSMKEQEIGSIVVGVDLDSSRRAVVLAEAHCHIYASVGLHPNDTPEEPFDREAFLELLQHEKVVAVGECGLDNFRPDDPEGEKLRQRDVFEQHIRLAVEAGKPLMIHARPSKGSMDAYRDLIDILSSYKREHGDGLLGNIHFFVGGVEEAKGLIELGFTLSYTAVLTFARDYDDVVRYAPLSHLLTETDSPYVAPAPNRGKRNDPRAVVQVVEAIAEIRGEDSEMVRGEILQNVERVFKIYSE
jgi:TatD DNase family protein